MSRNRPDGNFGSDRSSSGGPAMRRRKNRQKAMFYAIETEQFAPPNHPLRPVKKMVDAEVALLNVD